MKEEIKVNSKVFLVIIMGLLSAFGPFVTDFYLPAFPAIKTYFQTSPSMVQLSLTAGLFGLGIGQLIIGTYSDKYGRKSILITSLVIFLISTIACLFAPTITLFILFRLIQGMAGSGSVVISKSVAADLFKDRELTSFFSMLMVVNGIAPIAAPVFGGAILKFSGWQSIFLILTGIGAILLICILFFHETLSKERRFNGSIWQTFQGYVPLIKNKQFLSLVLVQTAAMGALFAYISSSPFLLQKHFLLSPLQYSLCFGGNAIGIMAGSLILTKFDEKLCLRIGTTGISLFSILLAIVLVTIDTVIWTEIILIIFMIAIGLVLPSSAAMALNIERSQSGRASAVMGFFSFVAGSIVSPLTGLGNLITSTVIILSLCSFLSLFLTIKATGWYKKSDKYVSTD